jgi:mandelate racemase
MTKTPSAIRSVKARALVAPISRPVKNAFGVIEAAPLVLIDVATDQGVTGHAYLFGYSKLTLKPLVMLIEEIGRELVGKAWCASPAMERDWGWQCRQRTFSWQR